MTIPYNRLGESVLVFGAGQHAVHQPPSLLHDEPQKYPKSRIVGLSNSTTQKEHIERSAKGRGLSNLEVTPTSSISLWSLLIVRSIQIITADVNQFDFNGTRQ